MTDALEAERASWLRGFDNGIAEVAGVIEVFGGMERWAAEQEPSRLEALRVCYDAGYDAALARVLDPKHLITPAEQENARWTATGPTPRRSRPDAEASRDPDSTPPPRRTRRSSRR